MSGVSGGSSPQINKTATGARVVDANIDTNLQLLVSLFGAQALSKLGEHFLELNSQFITEEQEIKITGDGGKVEYPRVKPEEVTANFDVIVNPDTITKISPVVKQATLMNIKALADKEAKVQLDTKPIWKALIDAFPEMDNVGDIVIDIQEQGEGDIQEMLKGQMPEVHYDDDHKGLMTVVQKFLLDSAQSLPDETLLLFQQYLDEHRKYIEADAALERRFQQVYVGEPSVEDTIAILRGLKERYEVHHNVRITDGAVIAAATLSHRYISDRFLPDKAIDLIDEAASRLRMEITSDPAELDEIKRRIMQLEIEREALKKESDDASKSRLATLERELADLNEERNTLDARLTGERQVIERVATIKQEIEATRHEMETAQRQYDYSRASELQFGKLAGLEQQLKAAEAELGAMQSRGMLLKEEVGAEEVAEVVATWTHIPVSKLLEGEIEKLIKMEERLHERVIGQDVALAAVAAAVRRARAGLQDPNRPIGSFIFLGPTGVGKTELARALAEFLFDDESAMIRIDMSEYQERHTVSRLIGAPPGYVGYDEGGQLTEAVRRKPYSVVLFDEIEKAHREVFNTLLQMLDDGRLTDGHGRTVDFKNTVVIMTSNIGSQFINDPALTDEQRHDAAMAALRQNFPPEFLNRVDDIIVFHSLSRADLAQIIQVQLKRLRKILAGKGLNLELTGAAVAFLTEKGYDPAYGARPLKRAIQQYVQDGLALDLLQGRFKQGDTILADVDAAQGKIVFAKEVVGEVVA